MALHTVTSASAPSVAPDTIGEHFINTTTGDHYLAKGTSVTADWILIKKQFIPISKSASYTVLATDNDSFFLVDATSAAVTLTLPAISGIPDGFSIVVQKTDATTNTITLDGNAAETINGAATKVLSGQYDVTYIVKESSEWKILVTIAANSVMGPVTSTDNALARWDGTGGADIQNSGWVLSDTDEMTAGGGLVMGDNLVTSPKVKDYSLTHNAASSTAGAITFDYSLGNSFNVSLTENITAITLSNPPATGSYGEMIIELVQDATGGRTVSGWPAAVKWPAGVAPTITAAANSVDRISLSTRDGGTTWFGNFSQDYK